MATTMNARQTTFLRIVFAAFVITGAAIAAVAAYAVQMPAFQRMDFIGAITFVEAGLAIGLLTVMKRFGKIR